MKRYFILGTDTNCGKTHVMCQLLKYFQLQNKHVLGLKPIASGAMDDPMHDTWRIQSANSHPLSFESITPWAFSKPVSPHLASAQEGRSILMSPLVDFCTHASHNTYDIVLIEGAGGLMVPLNTQETWLDFLIKTRLPVILVVGLRLGCLNHALLTAHMLRHHGIECAGWIANELDQQMLCLEENVSTLVERLHIPLLARVAYQTDLQVNPTAFSSIFTYR